MKIRIIPFFFGVFLSLIATKVLAQSEGFEPPIFREIDFQQAQLGQLLFYDPILSGNKNISCATCHHPRFNTSDGLSLGIGDGGIGLGPKRRIDPQNPPEKRIPRNAPALFNLGAVEFVSMFHDGRLEADLARPSGIRTPLGSEMEQGFASVLSAQAMFPVLSGDEMAGHYSENAVSQAVRQGLITGQGGAWDILSKRIENIPAYRAAFDEVIGENQPIHFTHIADVIAAFIEAEWRATNSPFDRYLNEQIPLPAMAEAGRQLFYGKAACADCHSGVFQTDHSFHAIGMVQMGPGKALSFERHQRDTGRMHVTGDPKDAYAFRTPSLRNVAHTAPYGHAGAYGSLKQIITHHLDPIRALKNYVKSNAVMPEAIGKNDFSVLDDAKEVDQIAQANELAPMALSEVEMDQLIAFLHALTDEGSLSGVMGIPAKVPSGLRVDR